MHAALPYETPRRRRRSYVRRALRWAEAHYVPHAAFVVVLVFGILHYRAFHDANWYAFAYAKSVPVKPVAPVTPVAIARPARPARPPPAKSAWTSGGTAYECPGEACRRYRRERQQQGAN